MFVKYLSNKNDVRTFHKKLIKIYRASFVYVIVANNFFLSWIYSYLLHVVDFGTIFTGSVAEST